MQEFPILQKSWTRDIKSVEIVYPNKYYGGVYCLGPLVLYNLINKERDFICERRFLDQSNQLKSDIIGFTFQYELDYYNFFKILKSNRISLDKGKRKQIIFAGGPCVNLNYKPLQDYIDFFILGEAEPVIKRILGVYFSSKTKKEFLQEISKLAGVYIPDISNKLTTVLADLSKIDNYPFIQPLLLKLTKNFVFGDAFILEIERGCPYQCKFCSMSELHPQVRYRQHLKEIVDYGIKVNKRKKVVIYSASFTHPEKKELLYYLLEKNLQFSVPSIKIETIDSELLQLIRKGGQNALTIAPECGLTLRKKIGKYVSDEKLFEFAEEAKNNHFKALKLYFMLGLPEQSKKDINEMVELVNKIKVKFGGSVYMSINPFVPKPKTKFAEHRFDKRVIQEQMKYLKPQLKQVKYKIGSIELAYKEWRLAFADKIESS